MAVVAIKRHSSTSSNSSTTDQVASQYYVCTQQNQKLVSVDTYPSHPNGYRQSSNVPVFRGRNSCPYCLCSPCVITMPPDFLRGACGPHPANGEKRYRLYRAFWGLLNTLGVWSDEEYLQRKEQRTVIMDKRDIIPKCIITVSMLQIVHIIKITATYLQEVRRRYPSHDGVYKDYVSTFEAESALS